MEYRIGDFALITRLSVKSLRNYHDLELLTPTRIDSENGYRFYDESLISRARIITVLKAWNFSLQEIREILESCSDDHEVIHIIKQKKQEIQTRIKALKSIEGELSLLIENEKENKDMKYKTEIEIKETEELNIISITYKGPFSDCGKYIGKLYKAAKGKAAGKVFSLYSEDVNHDDPEGTVCLPVKKEVEGPGIEYRTIPAGKVISLIHIGPYDTIGNSYQKLVDYRNENSLEQTGPYREIYIKGPGFLFPGNPAKYVSEIQMYIK